MLRRRGCCEVGGWGKREREGGEERERREDGKEYAGQKQLGCTEYGKREVRPHEHLRPILHSSMIKSRRYLLCQGADSRRHSARTVHSSHCSDTRNIRIAWSSWESSSPMGEGQTSCRDNLCIHVCGHVVGSDSTNLCLGLTL